MLLRRCSGDSSAGVAVIFSGQACECFEGFLFKCCENRLMNEAPTQISFALFKCSRLLVIVLDITGLIFLYLFINLRCVQGLFVSLLAAGFGFGDHSLQLRWVLPFLLRPSRKFNIALCLFLFGRP